MRIIYLKNRIVSNTRKISTLCSNFFEWTLSFPRKPWAAPALYVITFLESIIWPIPTDVWLVPTVLARPKKAFLYGVNTTIFSVLGAIAAYGIGYLIGPTALNWLQDNLFTVELWQWIIAGIQTNCFKFTLIGAFSLLPFKAFTLSAGIIGAPLFPFIAASLLGRAGRFVTVGILVHYLGERGVQIIKKHFLFLSSLVCLAVIVYWFLQS